MLTLSSDFGSPYPAAMKGVLYDRTDATVVDVTHDLPPHDVRTAAFWLREVLPWFPPAVHVVVVDPGVGTDRRAIAVAAGGHVLVGPDNGVLLPPARRFCDPDAGDGGLEVFEIDPGDPASDTFHGRDVFAPAAAEIHHAGRDRLASVRRLAPTANWIDLRLPTPTLGADEAHGEVLVVDGFGNVITNVPGATVEPHFGETVRVNGEVVPVRRTYGEVDLGERLVTVGSHDGVELAANQARGDEAFSLDPHDPVHLAW